MKMATSRIFSLMFIFFLVLSSFVSITMGGRRIPSSVPSTMRPLTAQDGEFVKMKPRLNKKQRVFAGREATGCLPKGFRHSSTPSRYVNNEPFVSCSSKVPAEKPWLLNFCFTTWGRFRTRQRICVSALSSVFVGLHMYTLKWWFCFNFLTIS